MTNDNHTLDPFHGDADCPDAIRTGDLVGHIPSGEEWVVAWADYATGYMSACGWPESQARISDCALLKKASDEECAKLAQDLAKSGRRDSHRAAAILAALPLPPVSGAGE